MLHRISWLLTPVIALPLAAQSLEGRLIASAGTATDTRGARSAAWSIVTGLALAGPHARAALQGRYSRFQGEGWAAGGGAGTAAVFPLSRAVALGVEAGGEYTRTSYADRFLTLTASPRLQLSLGPVTVSGGGTGILARISSEQVLQGGPLGPPVPSRSSATRHGTGPMVGVDVRVLDLPRGGGVRLGVREERLSVEHARYIDRTARAVLSAGPVSGTGTLGVRDGPGETRTYAAGRAAVALGPGLSLLAILESYPANPVTGALAGRTASAAVAFTIGPTRGRHASFPRPASALPPAAGLTRVAIRARQALRVEVAGDWNDWHPVPLKRTPNGVWYADLPLPAGTYRYAFRVDGTAWQVPRGMAAVDDGYGGQAAWLTVPSPAARPTQPTTTPEE